MRALPPCKKDGVNCIKRSPGCHSRCKEYNEFRAQREAENEAIKKQRSELMHEKRARKWRKNQ